MINWDCFDDELADGLKSSRRARKKKNRIPERPVEEQRIVGSDKNAEGQQMASIIYAIERGRFPNTGERRTKYNQLTKGHASSITPIYREIIAREFGEEYAHKQTGFIATYHSSSNS